MFDKELMLIDSSANVTASVTGTGVDFRGEDHHDLEYRIIIPAVAASTSAVIKLQESTDDSTYKDYYVSPSITAASDFHVHGRAKGRYRRAVITGTGSNQNFGKIKIGVVPAGIHRDW